MRRIGLLLWAVVLGLSACAPTTTGKNKLGNKLYSMGQYDRALSAYQSAQEQRPDAPELHYNAGNTLYQLGDYTRAISETAHALAQADPALQEQTLYNLGNSFYRQGQYGKAIAAYTEALKLNPDDREAKHNLEVALEKLKEQQTPVAQSQSATPTPTPTSPPGGPTVTPTPQGTPGTGSGTPTVTSTPPQAAPGTPTPQGGSQGTSTPEAQPTPAVLATPGKEDMTRQQAEQLLDALKSDEKTLQEQLQPRSDRPVEKDW